MGQFVVQGSENKMELVVELVEPEQPQIAMWV